MLGQLLENLCHSIQTQGKFLYFLIWNIKHWISNLHSILWIIIDIHVFIVKKQLFVGFMGILSLMNIDKQIFAKFADNLFKHSMKFGSCKSVDWIWYDMIQIYSEY